MFMPSIFGENLLDDFFDFPKMGYTRGNSSNGLMQTDIADMGNGYEVTINLPGFKKEDVTGELKDGYLVVTATTNSSNDEKANMKEEKPGKIIVIRKVRRDENEK